MDTQPIWQDLCRLLSALWAPGELDLASPLPWLEIIDLARSQGVTPFLRVALQRAGIRPPADIQTALDQAFYASALVDTHRLRDLGRILDALAKRDIPVVVFKGAALGETLYRDVGLRATGDLDLLIHPQHLPACRELLAELGYASSEVELTPGSHLDYRNEQAFSHPDRVQAVVELHWHLLDVPYYIRKVPIDWFWQHTETVEIEGRPVRVLNPEANLLYLPAHLALHHRFHGLRWFVDLALLVHKRQADLDWASATHAAQEFELLLVLRQALERLAAYWPSLPLKEPLTRLHGLEPTAFEQRLFHLLTAEPRSPLLDFYGDILCLPTVAERARFVLHNVFPQRAYMVKRYKVKSRWKLPYWYLVRLGEGLHKLARTLPQALRLR